MKTREPPPEGKGKGVDAAARPDSLKRFKQAAKTVLNVDRDKVLQAERKAKRHRDD